MQRLQDVGPPSKRFPRFFAPNRGSRGWFSELRRITRSLIAFGFATSTIFEFPATVMQGLDQVVSVELDCRGTVTGVLLAIVSVSARWWLPQQRHGPYKYPIRRYNDAL